MTKGNTKFQERKATVSVSQHVPWKLKLTKRSIKILASRAITPHTPNIQALTSFCLMITVLSARRICPVYITHVAISQYSEQ
jgi:hypothetical protein